MKPRCSVTSTTDSRHIETLLKQQLNVGSLPRLTAKQHDDPAMEPLARYWIRTTKVTDALTGKWTANGFSAGATSPGRVTCGRSYLRYSRPAAVGHKSFRWLFLPIDVGPLLHAVWSTMAFDYVARQKISGTGMTYFVVKQIACPIPTLSLNQPVAMTTPPSAIGLLRYVLELSYTSGGSSRMRREMGDDGPPFRWDPERRSLLRADLDAAMLHIYGLDRTEAEHVLDSFPVVRKYDERDHGEYLTRRLVLEAYDRMAAAAALGGYGWTPLSPVLAGHGPRHLPQVR